MSCYSKFIDEILELRAKAYERVEGVEESAHEEVADAYQRGFGLLDEALEKALKTLKDATKPVLGRDPDYENWNAE